MIWNNWYHIILFLTMEMKRIETVEVYVVFLFSYFFFNQSKNNAVLEPRTRNFRGFVRL